MQTIWFGMAMLLLTGAVFSCILRAARIPGGSPSAAIAAGCLAGILLGASVLGATSPETHGRWFVGGYDEIMVSLNLSMQHQRELAVMQKAGVTEAALREHAQNQQDKLDLFYLDINIAQQQHKNAMLRITLLLLLLWSIASVLSFSFTRLKTEHATQAMFSGLFAAIISGGSTFLAIQLFIPTYWKFSIAASFCTAIGSLCVDARTLKNTAHRRAGLYFSNITALLITCAAIFITGQQLGDSRLSIMIPLVLLAGFLIAPLPAPRRAIKRTARVLLWTFLVPTLTALAFIHTPVHFFVQDFWIWIWLLVIAILCHDGRWLGAWLGIRLFGTSAQKRQQCQLSGALLDTNIGAAQASLAGVLAINWILPTPYAAVVFAALIIELTQPIRQPVAKWVDSKFLPPQTLDAPEL